VLYVCVSQHSGGVGYFRLGWVTSVYFRREFRTSRGGLLRGGLLLGYLHHGLRWVTSVDAHVMIPSHDASALKLQGVGLSSEQGTSNCTGLSTYVHMCSPSQGARLVIARRPPGDVRKITESNESWII